MLAKAHHLKVVAIRTSLIHFKSVGARGEEIPGDPAIGAPRVRIADMGDEELDQTFGGALISAGDKRWQDHARSQR